jgi:hypothetical protein
MKTKAREGTIMTKAKATCGDLPQFDRLTYFYGQMLHARDLQIEQAYFREKLKLHNRCLHGWGVVCGLDVAPVPVDSHCVPATDAERARLVERIEKLRQEYTSQADPQVRLALEAEIEMLRRKLASQPAPGDCAPESVPAEITIGCGLALDCQGNEIVVRQPVVVDLWGRLSHHERDEITKGQTTSQSTSGATIFLGLCFRECPIDPVRPVVADGCGAAPDCTFGKLRDGFTVVVTTNGERWKDDRCDTCCEPCGSCCVLVARIDHFVPGKPVEAGQIHSEARRLLSLRPTTRVTGVNWVHGGKYTPAQAAALLGSANKKLGGLEVRFSRPLRSETVVDGTFDVWVIEGGHGRSAGIFSKAGVLDAPSGATTDRMIFRDSTSETLNFGDRVLITLRSAFLLDDCCRPVDGAHVGGRVPLLAGSPTAAWSPSPTVCQAPPTGPGPWRSGADGADNFESWFWITNS